MSAESCSVFTCSHLRRGGERDSLEVIKCSLKCVYIYIYIINISFFNRAVPFACAAEPFDIVVVFLLLHVRRLGH